MVASPNIMKDERPDPDQPENGKSVRELWQNKNTGEQIQRHVLERNGTAPKGHPHYQTPKGW